MTTWTTRSRARTIFMDDATETMNSALITMDAGGGSTATTWSARRY